MYLDNLKYTLENLTISSVCRLQFLIKPKTKNGTGKLFLNV